MAELELIRRAAQHPAMGTKQLPVPESNVIAAIQRRGEKPPRLTPESSLIAYETVRFAELRGRLRHRLAGGSVSD